MTTFVLHDNNGILVSIGTVLADPMPAHLTAVALSDEEAAILTAAGDGWDAETRTVTYAPPEPPAPDPAEALQAQVAELTAALQALTGVG